MYQHFINQNNVIINYSGHSFYGIVLINVFYLFGREYCFFDHRASKDVAKFSLRFSKKVLLRQIFVIILNVLKSFICYISIAVLCKLRHFLFWYSFRSNQKADISLT